MSASSCAVYFPSIADGLVGKTKEMCLCVGEETGQLCIETGPPELILLHPVFGVAVFPKQHAVTTEEKHTQDTKDTLKYIADGDVSEALECAPWHARWAE